MGNTEGNLNVTERTDVQQEVKEDKIIPDVTEDNENDCSKEKTENNGISMCSTETDGQQIEPLDKKTEKSNKGSNTGESTDIHKETSVQEEMKAGEIVLDNIGQG